MSVQLHIKLVHETIDVSAVLAGVASTQAGAVVLFMGTTREFTQGRQTASLSYDAYSEMAERKMLELATEASQKWPVIACSMVHRLGPVGLGEASIAIAVCTPHRKDAFEAGNWLIDMLKMVVPIWKEEHWADGTREWVHPGLNVPLPNVKKSGE